MTRPADWRTPGIVLGCGALILTLAMGVRQGFGLFLPPMTQEYGWGRETFAFAMALSNLLWGAFQPFFGAVADRHGTARVVVLSEYGITEVSGAVHVNRALREAGLLCVRDELGSDKLDAGASEAFAVADHQVAHVYVRARSSGFPFTSTETICASPLFPSSTFLHR